jgi:hypothetical protein
MLQRGALRRLIEMLALDRLGADRYREHQATYSVCRSACGDLNKCGWELCSSIRTFRQLTCVVCHRSVTAVLLVYCTANVAGPVPRQQYGRQGNGTAAARLGRLTDSDIISDGTVTAVCQRMALESMDTGAAAAPTEYRDPSAMHFGPGCSLRIACVVISCCLPQCLVIASLVPGPSPSQAAKLMPTVAAGPGRAGANWILINRNEA